MVPSSDASPTLPTACTPYTWTQGFWGDLSLDGKRYFVVTALRVQHEDKIILVLFFIPVENKTGLIVSQEVFQLIDYIATCKQLQAFHGSKVLRILSDHTLHVLLVNTEKIVEHNSWPHSPQSLCELVDIAYHVDVKGIAGLKAIVNQQRCH